MFKFNLHRFLLHAAYFLKSHVHNVSARMLLNVSFNDLTALLKQNVDVFCFFGVG